MKIIRIVGRKEEADAFNRELLEKDNKNKAFILHFFMKGCIHCENLEPKMKKLENYMMTQPRFNHVTMGKIDSEMMNDVNVENAYQFPTLKVMKNGKTHEYTASPDEASILSWLDKLLAEKERNTNNTNNNNSNSNRTIVAHMSNHNSLGKKSLKNTNINKVARGIKLNKNTKKHKKSKKSKNKKKTKKTKKNKNNKKQRKTKKN